MSSMYSRRFKKFQRPSLLDEIKSILHQYSDDGQIFKEIIQNAEDAGASEVLFVLDKNDDRERDIKLSDEKLKGFQGPTLYAYNDAKFQESDWDGIRYLRKSNKAKDPLKVGRFGLGFKSVFHLTDMPCVSSGSVFAYLDPMESTLGEEIAFLELDEPTETSQTCSDFYKLERLSTPFWNEKMNSSEGTIFQFPLRLNGSELSTVCYSVDRMSKLIKKFMKEAVLTLLFLKRIKNIKIFTIEDGSDQLEEIYSCKLSDKTRKDYDTYKERFVSFMASSAKEKNFQNPQCCNHITEILEKSKSGEMETYSYTVSEYFGYKGSNKKFLKMMQNEDLSYLPLIGVAYPLIGSDRGGHVFSCLPLPLQSKGMNGMPVHVNGYFGLSQDRKDLKWKTLSTEESNDITVDWNINLISELLPIVYCNLIQYLIHEGYDKDEVYKAWPTPGNINQKWAFFLDKFFQKVKFLNSIFVALNGGLWEIPQNVYHLQENQFESSDHLHTVEEFLLKAGEKVARVPAHISKILEMKQVDKLLVHKVYKEKSKLYYTLQPSQQSQICSFMIQTADDVRRLKQQKLFPLINGGYMAVETHAKSNVYLIPTGEHPATILPSNDRVLDLTFFTGTETLLRRLKGFSKNGQINMMLLQSSNVVLDVLRSFFKSHNSRSDFGISWPSSTIQESWLQNFLDYRRIQGIPLKDLSHIPFILAQNGNRFLSVSSTNQRPLLVSHGCQKMSNEMQSFLLSCRVWFVDYTVKTQDINDFYNAGLVLAPDGRNIVKTLTYSQQHLIKANFENASGKLILEMQEAIKHFSRTQTQQIPDFCFGLPLFKIYGTPNRYGTGRSCNVVAASDVPKEWKSGFGDIVTLESIDKELVSSFQMKKLSFLDISLLVINNIGNLDNQQQMSFFIFFLENVKKCDPSKSFCESVKTKIKIFDGIKKVKKPMDLFETTKELKHLFFDEDEKFPDTNYDIATLKLFGLKSKKDISLADINTCIKHVSNSAEKRLILVNNKDLFLKKVQKIFTVIKEKQIDTNQLFEMPWIPVNDMPPRSYPNALKWYGQQINDINLFKKLSEIYPVKYQLHVGSSAYVCHPFIKDDFEVCFKEHPHVKYIPCMEVLFSHLKNIEESYNDNERGSFAKVVYGVYKHLKIYEGKLVEYAKENRMLIWQGRRFVPINQIILSKPSCGSLEPYFYHPPKEVVDSIGTLLREFGCEKNDFKVYIQTLQEIAKKNDESNNNTADTRLVFQIVKELAKNHAEECIKEKGVVFVPVESLRLKLAPLSECYYHRFSESTSFSSKNFVLHHELGGDIPKQLQIPTLVSKVLTGNKSNIFKPWGQREPLTQRLRKLLDDYQDGLAIMKEMIQNADDAGASQVKFLYDKRQNKNLNTQLFDPDMKSWQGPALFVYNNAIFSEDDFHNITRIGAATKELDITKIGRFGLGFNSVYHLTDVPSFLSDRSVVFFDPHLTYLENVLGNQSIPGIRVSLEDFSKDIVDFKDQFLVFQDIFGVNFDFSKNSFESYNGTLFRLPLRNEETARKSEIKKMQYSNDEMMKLLEKLETSLDTLLLFSQNVSSVEVYILDSMAQSQKEMKLLFSTHKSTTKKGKCVMQLVYNELQSLDMDNSYDVPSKEINNSPNMIFKAQIKTTKSDKEATRNWVVSTCVGSQRTFQFAAEHKGLVPCGGVAIEIGRYKNKVLPLKSGQFFCFLPLPIDNLLPVHLNGGFEIEKSRKSLKKYNKDEKAFGKKEWNELLAEDLSEAYYNLITHFQANFKMPLETLFACLPNTGSKNNSVSYALTKGIIQKVISSTVPLFVVNGMNKLIVWDQIKILHVHKEISRAAYNFMNLWYESKSIENYCLEIPHDFQTLVENLFCKTDWNTKKMYINEHIVLATFLQSISMVPLSVKKRDCLINYVLEIRKSSEEIGCDLTKTIWVPTSPNDSLKKPCELVNKNSKAGELFTECDEVFPLVKDRHFPYLEKLGMNSHDLSWMMILNRAQSIENLEQRDVKIERSEKLLYFISNAKTSCPPEILKELIGKRFLQVLQKPKQSVFKEWFGSKCLFSSPNVMYLKKYCNLVSSSQFVCKAILPEKQLQLHTNRPSFDTVKSQLIDLISMHKDNVTRPVLNVLDEIYVFLNKMWHKFSKEERQELSKLDLIWTKDMTLTKPSKVYVNAPCVLSGYVSTLGDVGCFNDIKFFEMVGVKRECTVESYAKAIEEMKLFYGDEPLSDTHLNEICTLILHIKEAKLDGRTEFYLPDVKKVLRKESNLCYKDFTDEYLEDEFYISESLPQDCIKVFKIKASSTVKYQKKANEVVNHWIPFGQNERLTTRIKNILRGYSELIDIFKEMFQNADDSGACEIHFILDKRHHCNISVFTENWKDLQGPALLVCNNGVFKEEDLTSIQNLGDALKKEDPLTTGKYGVGFNAVYNITDCPALLANVQNCGDMLCIFDPNMQYAVDARPDKPGSMVKDARNFLNTYSDVKSSFLLDEFDTTKKTVFRLPLRNRETAAKSEISKKITSVQKVEKQFQEVMKVVGEFLLFLSHLKIITFIVIEENGKRKIDRFQAKPYDISERRLKEFRQYHKNYAEKLGNIAALMNTERRLARHVCIQHFENGNFLYVWHWNVVEQCGFSNMESVNEDVKQLIDDNELHLIPKGGIAKLSTDTYCNVCEELIEKRASDNYKCNTEDENSDNSHRERYAAQPVDSGIVFCTLPLDVITGIPVIINGNFVLDYETRRNLQKSRKSIGFKWNQSIMKSCVVPCYVEFLQKRANDLFGKYELSTNAEERKIDSYYKMFPALTDAQTEYKSLIEEFYKRVYEIPLLIIHRFHEISICRAKDEFLHFVPLNEVKHLLEILKSAYLDIDIIPDHISKSFENVHLPLGNTTPKIVRERLKDVKAKILPNNKPKWPIHITVFKKTSNVKKVLSYVMQESGEGYISLQALPLCVTACENLENFSDQSPKIFSRYSNLFQGEQKHLFLHHSLMESIKASDKCFNYKNNILLRFSMDKFSKLLHEILPKDILENIEKPIILKDMGIVNKNWISDFWECVISILYEEKEYKEWIEKEDRLSENILIEQENAKENTLKLQNTLQESGNDDKIPLKLKLEKIKNLSMVLAKRGYVDYLIPIQKSKVVLNMSNFYDNEIKIILREKIGIFEPTTIKRKKNKEEYEILYPSSDILEIFGSIRSCEDIVEACLFANKHGFVENLTSNDAKCFLLFLQKMIDVTQSVTKKILHLPLFEKFDGTLSDGRGSIVAVHPTSVPLDGIFAVENAANIKILKDTGLEKLFKSMKFVRGTDEDYYMQYIIPNFDKLKNEDAVKHATYLKKIFYENKNILKRLKTVKFIPCRTGERKMCCDLYNSNNEIFKLMQLESNFIKNQEMESGEWVNFLKELGFHAELNQELIIRYARELEKETNREKFVRVSELLCCGMFSILSQHTEEIWKYENFLRTLSDIKFISSIKFLNERENLETVCPSRNGQILRMSYREGVNPSKKILVWTTEYILPSYAVMNQKQLKGWKKVRDFLQIQPIRNESVISHLRNIMNAEKNFINETKTCKKIDEKLIHIYEKSLLAFYNYVSKKANNLDPNLVQEISFMLVNESKYVEIPRKSLLPGEGSISPYLNSVHETLGIHFQVLEKLKCSRKPGIFHYANVLSDLHEIYACEHVLQPNDIIAAEKATFSISNLLPEYGYQHNKPLYLPTTKLIGNEVKITLSKESVFFDDFSKEKRLSAFPGPILPLKYSSETKSQYVNEILVKYLPEDIAPQRIGKCVREILSKPIQTVKPPIDHPGMALKKQLQHPFFLESFKRLLSHEHDLSKESSQSIDRIFNRVDFSILKSLETYYVYKGKEIAGSKEKKKFFMETEGEKLRLYFTDSLNLDRDVMYKTFAEMILKKVDHHIDEKVSMLLPDLLKKQVAKLSDYLDDCSIKREKSGSRRTIIPELGERVRKEQICLLRQDVTEFSPDECIAVDMSGDEDYVYAKIIRIVSGDQPGERVYEVQLGEENTQELHESKLYKFDRGYEKISESKVDNNENESQIVLRTGETGDDDDDFTEECLKKGYEEIIDEIRQIIKSIRGKPEDVRKSTIRRLFLTWHPDKHKEKTKKLATRVFQFLQNELKKSPESNQFENHHPQWSRRARESWENSRQFYQKYRQQKYQQQRRSDYSSFFNADRRNFNTSAPPYFDNTNPQPNEATRWMKQALFDLQTALENFQTNNNSHEWICFISHQAAEKAIKSAIFLKDYKDLTTVHNLITLTEDHLPEDGELKIKAQNMENVVISTERTKYPNYCPAPKIPRYSYTRDQASEAIDLAKYIVKHIKKNYNVNNEW